MTFSRLTEPSTDFAFQQDFALSYLPSMWREEYLFVLVAVSFHLVIFTVLVFDLFSTSKRGGKIFWTFFLFALPFFSAVVYQNSMKRRKRRYFF